MSLRSEEGWTMWEDVGCELEHKGWRGLVLVTGECRKRHLLSLWTNCL